jgi:hypothetical protein
MEVLMRSWIKTTLGAALALAATSGAALACENCSYHTYYRPVVVRHCAHIAPHHVLRPRVYTSVVVPVVSYEVAQQTRLVPETYYYTRYNTVEWVPPGYVAGARHYESYRDSSYGLGTDE